MEHLNLLANFKAIVRSKQTPLVQDFAPTAVLPYLAQNTPIFTPLHFPPPSFSPKQHLA